VPPNEIGATRIHAEMLPPEESAAETESDGTRHELHITSLGDVHLIAHNFKVPELSPWCLKVPASTMLPVPLVR